MSRALFAGLVLLLSAYFVRTAPEISGDSRLALAYAVVDEHTLVVDRYAAEEPPMIEDLAEYEGHYYMAKPPLPSFVAVVPYAILRLALPAAQMDSYWWRWLLTLLISGGALAATAWLVEQLANEAQLPRARLAGLARVVATPLLAYATLFVATSLGAAFVAGIALAAVRRRYLAAGLIGGAMLSTETVAVASAAVPLIALGIGALHARSLSRVAALTGGFVLAASPLVLYQAAAFGSPLTGIYTYLADPPQRAILASVHVGLPSPEAIARLLFSPRDGFFVVAPIAIVGAILLVRLWRERRDQRRMLGVTAGMAVVTIIAFSTLPDVMIFWPLRAQYGPRLLMPLLPLLCWPLAGLSARMLAPLTFVCAVPQIVAASIYQPLLNPGATFQVAEVFRRFVGDRTTPSLVGFALPEFVPVRFLVAEMAFVTAVLAYLARNALASFRAPRSA